MEFKNKGVCRHLHFGAHQRSQCCGCSSLNYAQCSNFSKFCAMQNFVLQILQTNATFFLSNLRTFPHFVNFVHCDNFLQFCALALFCKLCAIQHFCTCYAMWHFCVQCGNLLQITRTLANVAQCDILFCKFCKMRRFFLPNLSNLPPFVNFVHFLQFCAMAFFCKHCAIWHFCTCYAMWHFCARCGNLLRITRSVVTLANVAQCGICFANFAKYCDFFYHI